MARFLRFSSLAAGIFGTAVVAACGPGHLDENLGDARQAAAQALGSEREPNGTPATASPIGSDTVIRANIFQAPTDVDWFAFQGTAGEKVYAATMTAFSPSGSDTTMELIAPDGTTLIEGNLDSGSLSGLASSIAGAPLSQTGTHFLRILAGTTIRPYDLHFKVQSGAPVPEMEPNDFLPNPLPASGFVSGALTDPMDFDMYMIQLQAGDTLFASLDLDPTRDGTEWNGALLVGPFGMTNTMLVVDDAGGATGADSEAMYATVKNAGVYRVAVAAGSGAMMVGDYELSVAVHPATAASGNCTTYTSTDLAQPIPPDPGQITSTLTVPGSPRIADIDVSLLLTHTNPGDLDIYLVSPAGSTTALVTDAGSTNYQNWDFTLDDEAAFPAGLFSLNHGIVLQPESASRLDWFDGENAGGTWTLHVVDDAAMNGGTLQGFSITICEPPAAPTCAGGGVLFPVFSTDFEAGASGFTHAGVQDEWALGTPAFAPITGCHSGTSCFKTDLANTYNANSNQDLVSAPIDLAGVVAPVTLTWAMKYQLDSATFDHAWVDVREVGGANPQRVWEFTAAAMQTSIGNPAVALDQSAGWGVHTADISAYAGKQIELVFHLDSNAAAQLAGFAVDDVAVKGCGCGNGTTDPGELCDDGNMMGGDGCDQNCTPTGCGNGAVTMGETCDDGNMADGDGCDSNCTPTGCGNLILTGSEVCDDGNMADGDGCDSNCTLTGCGNGIVTSGEQCDDSNMTSGDGCASDCTLEGTGGAGGSTGSSSSGSGGGSAGNGGSGAGGGSSGPGGSGASTGNGGSGGNGGSSSNGSSSGGSTGAAAEPDLVGSEGGCNCSMPGEASSDTSSSFAALGVLGLLAARLRRSRR